MQSMHIWVKVTVTCCMHLCRQRQRQLKRHLSFRHQPPNPRPLQSPSQPRNPKQSLMQAPPLLTPLLMWQLLLRHPPLEWTGASPYPCAGAVPFQASDRSSCQSLIAILKERKMAVKYERKCQGGACNFQHSDCLLSTEVLPAHGNACCSLFAWPSFLGLCPGGEARWLW